MDVLLLCLRHELQLLLGLELQVGDGDWEQQSQDYLKDQYSGYVTFLSLSIAVISFIILVIQPEKKLYEYWVSGPNQKDVIPKRNRISANS